MENSNYYIITLQKVITNEKHPYRLTFKGNISTCGDHLYRFEYNGKITYTDAIIPKEIREKFQNQLREDYGFDMSFKKETVEAQLAKKSKYTYQLLL